MFQVATFGDGQVPSTAGVLCTAGVGQSFYIKNVILSNVGAVDVTLTLWKTIGANDRQILSASLTTGETVIGTNYLLAEGESLKAVASSAASIDYVIEGILQS